MNMTIRVDQENGGTPADQLADKGSVYEKILRTLSRNKRAVIMFKVAPGSFNTYLKARTMADKANVSAGWEIKPMSAQWLPLSDFEVKRLKDPPPPPVAPVKPKKPGPPKIDPKLD